MIRRGFFSKLLGIFGFSVPPIKTNAEVESEARRIRRTKMAEMGLGPDDIKISVAWQRYGEGDFWLTVGVFCRGEVYGEHLQIARDDLYWREHEILVVANDSNTLYRARRLS